MDARLVRLAGLLGMALAGGLLTGCVERRYVITTDQPGAIVYENGKPIGAAPADRQFLYYGNYRFTIVCDGCKTLVVDQCLKQPWYEYIPFDFIAENLIPWTIRDVRRFHYTLEPLVLMSPEVILEQAQALQQRGKTLGAPPAPEAVVVPGPPPNGVPVSPPPGAVPAPPPGAALAPPGPPGGPPASWQPQ